MSTAYALVMMAVMVGIIMQMAEDGILSPSSTFFLFMILQIVITGKYLFSNCLIIPKQCIP